MSDLYRVVIDGTGGRRSGSVWSLPMSRDDADNGLPEVLEVFAADIAAGDLRVSVLSEDEFARRAEL